MRRQTCFFEASNLTKPMVCTRFQPKSHSRSRKPHLRPNSGPPSVIICILAYGKPTSTKMARNPCQTVPCRISTVGSRKTHICGKTRLQRQRLSKHAFSKTFCGSNKEHIFDKTASKRNFCDDNLAPRTNQPPTTPPHGSRRTAHRRVGRRPRRRRLQSGHPTGAVLKHLSLRINP